MERLQMRQSGDGLFPTRMYSPSMTHQRQQLGILGERVAARWLRQQGWEIVQHRFRSGRRDVDLIVRSADTIAFIEVKARRGESFGSPVEAVHHRKQRELGRAARVWVDRFGSDTMTYRFDVVGVLVDGQNVRVRHIPNAFPVPPP